MKSLLEQIFKDHIEAMKTAQNFETTEKVQFRRGTSRYGKRKGTFSNNRGYLVVGRDTSTGRFVSPR